MSSLASNLLTNFVLIKLESIIVNCHWSPTTSSGKLYLFHVTVDRMNIVRSYQTYHFVEYFIIEYSSLTAYAFGNVYVLIDDWAWHHLSLCKKAKNKYQVTLYKWLFSLNQHIIQFSCDLVQLKPATTIYLHQNKISFSCWLHKYYVHSQQALLVFIWQKIVNSWWFLFIGEAWSPKKVSGNFTGYRYEIQIKSLEFICWWLSAWRYKLLLKLSVSLIAALIFWKSISSVLSASLSLL